MWVKSIGYVAEGVCNKPAVVLVLGVSNAMGMAVWCVKRARDTDNSSATSNYALSSESSVTVCRHVT